MSDEITRAASRLGVELNNGQRRAVLAILADMAKERTHLLTGYAGVGKTVVLLVVAIVLRSRGLAVTMCAPTHQAVAVIGKKLKVADVAVSSVTLASLLSLSPRPRGDRLVFTRRKAADPIEADVVLVDECSMISADVMFYVRRHLTGGRGVLFTGDPAQLPPVGEAESLTFANERHTHLDTIVRQAANNPIISAAHQIRAQQGHAVDWSWCKSAKTEAGGIYRPRDLDAWLHRAFTSDEFQADPTAYRYLAWTNRRVADVNARVRSWLYGEDIPTPFVVGERALLRAPIVVSESIVAHTNEEARVTEIAAGEYVWQVPERGKQRGWSAAIPTWKMKLKRDQGDSFEAHMVRDERPYEAAQEKLREAHRWKDLHAMRQFFANFQAVYARTVHTSQGETHKHTFLDIPDIRRRMHDNPLEMQQLCYVGATRPTTSLILAGI